MSANKTADEIYPAFSHRYALPAGTSDLCNPRAHCCPELIWATSRLMSPDHGFGTSCLLHCGHLTVSANSEDS